MRAYKIAFDDGTLGYQLMTDERFALGLYTEDGQSINDKQGCYSVTDAGADNLGVELPGWAQEPAPPPPDPSPVPQQVSPYQARIALLGAGRLDAVNALMASPDTPAPAKIAWEYATYIERTSPFVAALAPALGLTDEEVDALFIAAAQVT